MPSKEESKRLIVRLARIASEADEAERERRMDERYDQLLNHIDVTPYKKTAAWPGKSYLLIGSSFNTDATFKKPREKTRRAACIALLINKGADRRNCVSLAEALSDEGFTSVLSRFEKQWLAKLQDTTLIGPAYNEKGKLIPQAFAVWRKEIATAREKDKQLVAAGRGQKK
ncbi:MAG: hypothetical protein IT343_08510 [Candidatus Melainabacteria bacterium]|jgi:hypothetical protein|nr:hypothetical protein [Candidatus Melainabacteria bacterium]